MRSESKVMNIIQIESISISNLQISISIFIALDVKRLVAAAALGHAAADEVADDARVVEEDERPD